MSIPSGNSEDEADYAEDEKYPLDKELVGHQDVKRLGANARDNANGTQYPPTLKHPHLLTHASMRLGGYHLIKSRNLMNVRFGS